MTTRLGAVAAGVYLASFADGAFAHRLDEYLQATMFDIGKEQVRAQIRLTPGVAVFVDVMADMDQDRDGALSESEGRAYAGRVLGDLSLSIDGERRELELVSVTFPDLEQMRQGLGEVKIDFAADARGGGSLRKLTFENRHQATMAAYLVNVLTPEDADIQVVAQHRNYEQSAYELEYSRDGGAASPAAAAVLGIAALALLGRLALLRRRQRAAPKLA